MYCRDCLGSQIAGHSSLLHHQSAVGFALLGIRILIGAKPAISLMARAADHDG
jgi:hypothetical protein